MLLPKVDRFLYQLPLILPFVGTIGYGMSGLNVWWRRIRFRGDCLDVNNYALTCSHLILLQHSISFFIDEIVENMGPFFLLE